MNGTKMLLFFDRVRCNVMCALRMHADEKGWSRGWGDLAFKDEKGLFLMSKLHVPRDQGDPLFLLSVMQHQKQVVYTRIWRNWAETGSNLGPSRTKYLFSTTEKHMCGVKMRISSDLSSNCTRLHQPKPHASTSKTPNECFHVIFQSPKKVTKALFLPLPHLGYGWNQLGMVSHLAGIVGDDS